MSKWAILAATLGLLGPGSAWAQQGAARSPHRATTATAAAYEYDYYNAPAASDSPSDVPLASDNIAPDQAVLAPAADAPLAAQPGCCDSGCCDTGCNEGCQSCSTCCDCCCDWCDLGEPWVLFDGCCLKQNNITIAGWLDQGYTWNPQNPADGFNGPVTFNDRANEYQMNQLYLYAEKALDTENGWDIGGRVDLMYGTDWRFTPAEGLENHLDGADRWNQSNRFYGLAMPQLYGEVGIYGLSVKVGHFYTIIGYEVVPATGNFFYSHAYTMQYGEPFTHTGALASWKMTDQITAYGGIVRGWDNWEDANDEQSFLGGVTWTSCDEKTSLAFALVTGDEDPAGVQNRTMYSVVLTRQLNDKWKYVLQHDRGCQSDAIAAGVDAEWYGINQYLFYTVNDCLSYGVRGEWFRDDDGFRVAGTGTGVDPSRGWTRGGFAGDFYEVTLGANYKPHANVLVRPELRWDWYDGLLNAAGELPYDNGADDNQFLLGTDVIVTF